MKISGINWKLFIITSFIIFSIASVIYTWLGYEFPFVYVKPIIITCAGALAILVFNGHIEK